MKESMIPTTTLLQGDCLELMGDIPDKSIDAIICDLPYGTTSCKWDSIIPFEPLWEQYERTIKDNGAIVLTASQPFASALIMSNPKIFKYQWVWYKNLRTGFANAKRQPMKAHELVLVFYKKPPTYNPIKVRRTTQKAGNKTKKFGEVYNNTYYQVNQDNQSDFINPHDVLEIKCIHGTQKRYHNTQKPVELLEYLLKTYTNEGDVVLDNTMGSGTTGIACINTNRNFIGMELDEGYFNIATNRIQEAKNNKTVF